MAACQTPFLPQPELKQVDYAFVPPMDKITDPYAFGWKIADGEGYKDYEDRPGEEDEAPQGEDWEIEGAAYAAHLGRPLTW